MKLFEGLSPDQMADTLFGNRQRTSTSSGILKAEAVRLFAASLQESKIDNFGDLDEAKLATAETLVSNIPGQKSGISFDYFRMLAGDDNLIKPDRMVQRYIAKAISERPEKLEPDQIREIMQATTALLVKNGQDWSARRFDYAIWKTESSKV